MATDARASGNWLPPSAIAFHVRALRGAPGEWTPAGLPAVDVRESEIVDFRDDSGLPQPGSGGMRRI